MTLAQRAGQQGTQPMSQLPRERGIQARKTRTTREPVPGSLVGRLIVVEFPPCAVPPWE